MNKTRTRLGLLPRRLLALGLVAWFAGLGCALGCGAASASVAKAGQESPAESCAAMSTQAGPGCCHRVKNNGGESANVGTPARDGWADMHCPLARQTSDPARKIRTNDAPVTANAPARTHQIEPRQGYVANTPRPLAHDRGGTYLRCCVFLI